MTRCYSSLLLAAAFAANAVPALAQAAEPLPTAVVRHADLDLGSAGGVATFRGRVKAAANRACGMAPMLPFHEADAVSACRAAVVRSGERQLLGRIAAHSTESDVRGTR